VCGVCSVRYQVPTYDAKRCTRLGPSDHPTIPEGVRARAIPLASR